MNDIKVFENSEFGQVRVIERNGEPWFVGKDVAESLGYSNTKDAISNHVDEEDDVAMLNCHKRDFSRDEYHAELVKILGDDEKIANEMKLYDAVMTPKSRKPKK